MILIRALLEEGVEELRYRRHGGGGWRRRNLWRKWEGKWGRDGQGEEERVGERKTKGKEERESERLHRFSIFAFCVMAQPEAYFLSKMYLSNVCWVACVVKPTIFDKIIAKMITIQLSLMRS